MSEVSKETKSCKLHELCQIFLVAILSQLIVTAFVPLNVDILSHELFKSLYRTWRTKSLLCLLITGITEGTGFGSTKPLFILIGS